MMEVDDCSDLRLDGLPNELLLHIFQYLDVEFILQAVSKVLSILSGTIRCMYNCIHILLKVCNLFHELASDETTWRVRVAKRFPGRDPVFTFTLIYVVGSLSPPKYQVSILPCRRPRTFVGRWHVPVERMKRGCGGAARRGRPRGSPSTAPLPTMQL